ncbi:hypothetical protein ACHAXA_001192 [Cyclostephanos tholiformis]|uniref:Uncharacterized protein n=1 Tax=Cyclostephanos tholiformis TaxID=382380 RepID=A0ABD3SQ03_9STRA
MTIVAGIVTFQVPLLRHRPRHAQDLTEEEEAGFFQTRALLCTNLTPTPTPPVHIWLVVHPSSSSSSSSLSRLPRCHRAPSHRLDGRERDGGTCANAAMSEDRRAHLASMVISLIASMAFAVVPSSPARAFRAMSMGGGEWGRRGRNDDDDDDDDYYADEGLSRGRLARDVDDYRIVIGLFGNDSPQPVLVLRRLSLDVDGRMLERERLEAQRVYNSCLENEDAKGVIKDVRIDLGTISGRYVARESPTFVDGPTRMRHDAPGVVSVRRWDGGGYGFTIYPGHGYDDENDASSSSSSSVATSRSSLLSTTSHVIIIGVDEQSGGEMGGIVVAAVVMPRGRHLATTLGREGGGGATTMIAGGEVVSSSSSSREGDEGGEDEVGGSAHEHDARAWSRWTKYCDSIGLDHNYFVDNVPRQHRIAIMGAFVEISPFQAMRGEDNCPEKKSGDVKPEGKTKEIEHDTFNNTGPHDATLFNNSLKNIADHLQLTHGNEVSEAIRNLTKVTISVPPAPTGKPDPVDPSLILPITKVDLYLWKREHSKAQDQKDKYDENMAKAYIIVYHQCSPNLKNDLKASSTFPSIHIN